MSVASTVEIVDGPFVRDGLLLNFIAGEWTAAAGGVRSRDVDPATEVQLVDVAASSEADATAALAAAANA